MVEGGGAGNATRREHGAVLHATPQATQREQDAMSIGTRHEQGGVPSLGGLICRQPY